MVDAEEFSKYYNDSKYTIRKIMRILNISSYQYEKLRNASFEKGLIRRQRKVGRRKEIINGTKKNPRCYYWNRQQKKYVVRRWNTYYASFKTVTECKRFIKLIEGFDWDKNKSEYVKELVLNGTEL